MKKRKRNAQRLLGLFVAVCVALSAGMMLYRITISRKDISFGTTFSKEYAMYLGLDWKETYTALLDDLTVGFVRIPLQWSNIESEKGVYSFDDIDWMMREAALRKVDVILAIGQKVPRWPECFTPKWAEGLEPERKQEALIAYGEAVALRYREHPALIRWQVENEPYFPFGECPQITPRNVSEEIATIRAMDSAHEIMVTTSGEQSYWPAFTADADLLGVSLYRVVHDKKIGILVFPHIPGFYLAQNHIARFFTNRVVISELQAEPWGTERLLAEKNIDAAYGAFTAEDLQSHFDFARKTGMREISFWGVEWWYFLKKNGKPELWRAAHDIIEIYGGR